MTKSNSPVGLTQDTGWQIGVRRTLPIHYEAAWRLLTSAEGVAVWLGSIEAIDFSKGATYRLADGTSGTIRVFEPNSHLRLTWQPPNWPRASTLQLRVIPKGDKTTIAFHQEHLPDQTEREARKLFFTAALDALARLMAAN